MSLIDTKIKPFKNMAFQNGKFITVTDKDIEGKWNLFVFYPADFTFICPTELSDIADYYEDFKKINVNIYSISTDTHFAHKEWHDNSRTINKIQFTMIGDPTGSLTRNFNIMNENNGLAYRGTFLIDINGIIRTIEITSDGIGRNAVDTLRKVKAAQYVMSNPGEVCPAKWQEGEHTLTPSISLVGKI